MQICRLIQRSFRIPRSEHSSICTTLLTHLFDVFARGRELRQLAQTFFPTLWERAASARPPLYDQHSGQRLWERAASAHPIFVTPRLPPHSSNESSGLWERAASARPFFRTCLPHLVKGLPGEKRWLASRSYGCASLALRCWFNGLWRRGECRSVRGACVRSPALGRLR
jgi:hypothetical protein